MIDESPKDAPKTSRRLVPLQDEILNSDGNVIGTDPHKHEPANLGFELFGPMPGGSLMLDRAWMRLCKHCHLVYWEQLDPVFPKPRIIQRGNHN